MLFTKRYNVRGIVVTRLRRLSFSSGLWTSKKWVYNYSPTIATYAFVSDYEIIDEKHAWPLPKRKGLMDVGGYLHQVKYDVDASPYFVDLHVGSKIAGNSAYNYVGPVFARHGNSGGINHASWSKTPPVSELELLTKGATAISRCAPTNPHASLSQALGELRRDGIPAVPALRAFQKGARPRGKSRGSKQKATKKEVAQRLNQETTYVGSQYLNVEFGWKPLLSDVRKLAAAQRQAEMLIAQYVRNSGRLVRRRYDFPTTVTVTEVPLADSQCQPVTQLTYYTVPYGKCTQTTTVTRRIWFEGAFTYHVSDPGSLLGKARYGLQVANHLSGIGITPGVLWDLSPWSWAADWFGNTGDVLNNVSMMQSDGLVVVYGYIMAETVTVKTFTNSGCQFKDGKPPVSLTQTFTETVRQRRRATPFGFGLDVANFTPRQIAIVSALGLSRDGRKLAL